MGPFGVVAPHGKKGVIIMRMDKVDTGLPLAFNPLIYPIATRVPDRFDVLTTWLGHVPFAMTLIDMIRPDVVVELGTHWGVSYCAFCQAVKELGLSTRCYAVDTWHGHSHAAFYSEEVLDNLKEHHDPRYAPFSQLIRSTFEEALSLFEDGSVDLMHIDGYHSYDAVKHDFETWLPKLSTQGVVLFHRTEVRDRDGFGVWSFWDELKRKYPNFEFLHSHGLGVVAVGQLVPENLNTLLRISVTEQNSIRRYFSNLGNNLVRLNDIATQNVNLTELVSAKTEECERLDDDRVRLSNSLEEKMNLLRVKVEEYEEYRTQENEERNVERRSLVRQLAAFSAANKRIYLPRGLRWRPFREKRDTYKRLVDSYRIISSSPLFDRSWYWNMNPDVRGMDPIFHYITCGASEGRAPGPLFDGAEYERVNADVLEAGTNPLVHYIRYGHKEVRTLPMPSAQR
jgi:Methyltransferase domain